MPLGGDPMTITIEPGRLRALFETAHGRPPGVGRGIARMAAKPGRTFADVIPGAFVTLPYRGSCRGFATTGGVAFWAAPFSLSRIRDKHSPSPRLRQSI